MNRLAVLCAAVAVALAVSAADTKAIKSRDGGCQITVPGDWSPGALGGTADSADHKVSAAVSSPRSIDSFDQLKRTAQIIYRGSKVTKDSASEFEMEGKSISNKPNVYRAIALSGNKFCVSEVMYEGGTVEDARKIAQTVSSAK